MSIIIRNENNKHWVYSIEYIMGGDLMGDYLTECETRIGEIKYLKGLEVNKEYNLDLIKDFVQNGGYISLKSDLIDLTSDIFKPWSGYLGRVPKIG
jgi:restriction endonuclease S subunit